jgi:hypothetical protein
MVELLQAIRMLTSAFSRARGAGGQVAFPCSEASRSDVAVRDATPGLNPALLGVKLIREAFKPRSGPLTDPAADGGEQVARTELFAGAIGCYKNPHSHRDVDLDDPAEGMETSPSALPAGRLGLR